MTIAFDWSGNIKHGELKSVAGGGNLSHLHLIVDRYYWGQALKSDAYGWQFSSNTIQDSAFKEMIEAYLRGEIAMVQPFEMTLTLERKKVTFLVEQYYSGTVDHFKLTAGGKWFKLSRINMRKSNKWIIKEAGPGTNIIKLKDFLPQISALLAASLPKP
jgi:hypothetical protein